MTDNLKMLLKAVKDTKIAHDKAKVILAQAKEDEEVANREFLDAKGDLYAYAITNNENE